jgi:hypothetical protein
MKLTDWYSGNQKPVRVGVYEREYGTKDRFYCYWNGYVFGCADESPCNAWVKHFVAGDSLMQYLPWRGVAK